MEPNSYEYTTCPSVKCRSKKAYRIDGNKYTCPDCGKTFFQVGGTKMKIDEIFYSIHDGSSWAGLPCTVIKFSESDSASAEMTAKDVAEKIMKFENGIIEFTGSEPLLKEDDILNIMDILQREDPDRSYHFLIETNGSIMIDKFTDKFEQGGLKHGVYFIINMRMPSSGMFEEMKFDNFHLVSSIDEVNFSCGDRNDYDTAKKIITDLKVDNALISPILGKIEPKELAEWIIGDKLRARFNLPIRKFMWKEDKT